MGMSSSVKGIKPPDETWKKMKAVWDACVTAGIETPVEVDEFFGWENPDKEGVIVNRDKLGDAVEEYNDEYSSGYQVHIDKLPKDIKIIRFTNSW